MGFYKNAWIGTVVSLILTLLMMVYILSNQSKSQEFPATLPNCPDFYSLTNDGKCAMETSVYASQDAKCKMLQTNGMSGREKKVWAVDCGVSWDGITNNSSI